MGFGGEKQPEHFSQVFRISAAADWEESVWKNGSLMKYLRLLPIADQWDVLSVRNITLFSPSIRALIPAS